MTSATPIPAWSRVASRHRPCLPAQATITPASSGTLADYFKEKGVKLEPQNSRDFKALNIVLPVPNGWARCPTPTFPTRSR